jgi:hypothetical protein
MVPRPFDTRPGKPNALEAEEPRSPDIRSDAQTNNLGSAPAKADERVLAPEQSGRCPRHIRNKDRAPPSEHYLAATAATRGPPRVAAPKWDRAVAFGAPDG